MDLDVILDMDDATFEEWLARESKESKARFKEGLEKACEGLPKVIEARPFTREDLKDAHEAILATPNIPKPAPLFFTEEDLRALRKKHKEEQR